MEYKINPAAYSGIFPVPSAIVDENIRLASVVQLKVILYLLRHSAQGRQISCLDVANALFLDAEDVADAMIFWRERGIVIEADSAPVPVVQSVPVTAENTESVSVQSKAAEIKQEAKPTKKVADIPISRPSHEQIAARCKESEEISLLFREAQQALGKTIGYDGQSVLIMMYDSYGLPVEVILMAIEYSLSQGKASFSSIAKIGRRWSEMEIDNLEGAMEYIEDHNVVNETWNKLRALTDISNKRPTQKQFGYLTAWIKEYGYDADMIYYAYEESVDRTGKMSMPYMDKIITGWHKNGVKTPMDIEKEKLRWRESQAKKAPQKGKPQAAHEQREPSYDIGRFLEKGVDLKYDKNDKNA